MTWRDVTRDAVLKALGQAHDLGRVAFREAYHFGPARDYVVVYEGEQYDSKAIVGVAHSFLSDKSDVLSPDEFSGGEQEAAGHLKTLGFEVKRLSDASEEEGPRVWLIRAGEHGEYEDLARREGVAVIGWSDLGRLDPSITRDDLKEQIQRVFGETRPRSLASQAGEVYRFMNEVQLRDFVVLPLRSNPDHVAVGRVSGSYQYREDGAFAGTDAVHTRSVEWLAPSIPYERFDPEMRETFGQRGTLSEISKPNAAQRVNDVLAGTDASAIHLVLKWSPKRQPDTIEQHRAVADQKDAVWWGRIGNVGTTGLASDWLSQLQEQLDRGSTTYVFLHKSSATTWRTRLLRITTDERDVERDLVPTYYDSETNHTLWVKVTDFEEVDPHELTETYVLAQSGDPVTAGGLANQGPLIIREKSATHPGRFFALSQSADGDYDDIEGSRYSWTERSSGAWKQLANSAGARFVYYRPGSADDGTGQTYFGTGRISGVQGAERDGRQHFAAAIEDYEPFTTPVPFSDGPVRNAQTSIQQITRADFKRLLARGLQEPGETGLEVDEVRAAAEAEGLILSDSIYAQLVAALNSGKNIILTGAPGTAKTTLAQAVASAAEAAGLCDGFVPTTATADWTTYETIGGLRPTVTGELQFAPGHFVEAIESNRWLVIDELNRSEFDRAFGQLFTVLSGQTVVLPYRREGSRGPLVLLPGGETPPITDADVVEVRQSWRIIGTMNVFDKNQLFAMSFAMMRRFAFIEVSSPSDAVFEALIDREAGGDTKASGLAKQLLKVRDLKDLGPAVFMDIARYLRARVAAEDVQESQVLFETFYSYLLPQFEGIDSVKGTELYGVVVDLVGTSEKSRVCETLNAVLGLELQGQPPSATESVETAQPEVGQDEDDLEIA